MKRTLAAWFAWFCAVVPLGPTVLAFDVISESEATARGGATGGDEIRLIDNGDKSFDIVHIFRTIGAKTLNVPAKNDILDGSLRLLVVGGGGAGGQNCGGGGGAGEYLELDNLTLSAGTLTATVGAGGAAVPIGGTGAGNGAGHSGSSSTVAVGGTTYTAQGGGGGGSWNNRNGRSGGSGGGSSGYSSLGGDAQRGASTAVAPGLGHRGGTNNSTDARRPAGGGGGAGSAGGDGTGTGNSAKSGAGGAGVESEISGEALFYAAGGGGGGADNASTGALGGSGIGGRGTGNISQPATAGAANTGSGGGGGAGGTSGIQAASGAGGSGVVIVRYTVNSSAVLASGATRTEVGADEIFTFGDCLSEGTLTVRGTVAARVLVVGGGGAGASPATLNYQRGGAGGGGAGGLVEVADRILTPGTYRIAVGAGGAAGSATAAQEGADGQPSKIFFGSTEIFNAAGGGGGGLGTTTANGKGHDGGSGGGGSAYSSSATRTGGQPVAGQGFAGGTGTITRAGAGGGGAGGAGGNTVRDDKNDVAGDGGDGLESDITGEARYYAAGGGGGSQGNYSTYIGIGGSGGNEIGGNGGGGSRTGGQTAATAGLDGTGSGGGGGAYGQAGGAGGSGIVIIRITKVMPAKPTPAETTWVYDGLEHEPVPAPEGSHLVVTGTARATEVGNYTLTVTPEAGYVWSDGTSDAVVVAWSITRPVLTAESLTVRGWQVKATPNEPVLTIRTREGVAVTLPEANVVYLVRVAGAADWTRVGTREAWAAFAAALGPGAYEITAEVTGTESYDPPATIPVGSWTIWEGRKSAVEGLAYSFDLTVSGVTGAPGTQILEVELGEDLPEGFTYRHAQPDGSDIRFTDAAGNLLAATLVAWNPDGCSIFAVQVPDCQNGTTIRMSWGRTVDEDGADIPLAPQPALTRPEPLYHFDFDGRKTNSGTQTLNMADDAGLPGVYEKTGLASGDQAISRWTGYSTGSSIALPSGAYTVALTARVSPTAQETGAGARAYSALWAIGDVSNGGFGLVADPGGEVRLVEWSDQSGYRTILRTTVSRPAETYHRYVVNISASHQGAELRVDGQHVATGTLMARSGSQSFQFNGVHGGGLDGVVRTTDSWLADWWLDPAPAASLTASVVYTTENARLKNYWVVTPDIGAREWGTGQEPTPNRGLAAYGDSYFEITPLGGTPLPVETYPTSAGTYSAVFRADAGGDALVSWTALASTPVIVEVTAHSPYADLGGTASGRVLLANDFRDAKTGQNIVGQDYATTTGPIAWTHDATAPHSWFPNLKIGLNHVLTADTPNPELCGGTNLWTLTDVYLGTTLGFTTVMAEGNRPIWFPTTDENPTQLVMNNKLDAEIRSSCFTNGIGTIYFDVLNGWQDVDGTNYSLRVEICEGVVTTAEGYKTADWRALTLHPLFHDSQLDAAFTPLAATEEFSPNATREYDEGSFYRVYAPVDVRGPVTFRIRRTSVPNTFAESRGGFLIFDNIIASHPATRAELEPAGPIDPTKHGKAVVGVEGAATVPFAAVNEPVYLRAKAKIVETVGAPKPPEIIAARAFYRWRYLTQAYDPADGTSWKAVNLSTTTFAAADPLDLPAGRVGDVEFWYTLTADAPYYSYYDYSGLNLKIADYYSEERAVVTNRYEGPVFPATKGSDWFLRLREGRSALAGIVATARDAASNDLGRVTFELTADRMWRGYLPTAERLEGGASVQIAALGVGETNVWKTAQDVLELPASIELRPGTTNDWTRVVCDAATGGLMFQIDESSQTLTVAHADYQDFNRWNDAHRRTFVGTSVETNKMAGVSPLMRDYEQDFATWTDTPAQNAAWRESFVDGAGDFTRNWKPFEAFSSKETPNGWTAGPGMWVNERYSPDSTVERQRSGAYQMEGAGKGYLEYPGNMAVDPRGAESFSYRARLAQTIAFDDIAWRYIDGLASHDSYTFSTQVVMDGDSITTGSSRPAFLFDGAGQVSVIANYRPMLGCYEFRMTRVWDARAKFEIFKWTASGGTLKAETLVQTFYNFNSGDFFRAYRANNGGNPQYPTMFITVEKQADGTVKIMGGFSKSHSTAGADVTNFVRVNAWDANPGRLSSGTYGVASANCNARFVRPRIWSQALEWPTTDVPSSAGAAGTASGDFTVTWPATSYRAWEEEPLNNGDWMFKDGRLAAMDPSTDRDQKGQAMWGIKAVALSQKLAIEYKQRGRGEWQPLVTNTVSGFTFSAQQTINLYSVKDAIFRVAHAGTFEDARVDVCLDDVEIRQWRGDDFGSVDTDSYSGPSAEAEYGYRTNIVFTSGWVTGHKVKLSAKRTQAGSPCSIRSPLMDGLGSGKNRRGIGLGMVSFNYVNAQAGVNLLVQVATNNVSGTIRRLTQSLDDEEWTTVTNFTFEADSPNGTRNCYLGLHGVSGAMRLLLDPKCVAAVANETNPARFREITITSVLFRDEPELDEASWWGWNVNTVNDDGTATWHDGTRTYLPDAERGLSLALNNSTVEDVEPKELDSYKRHQPFVQTPTFTNNVVGEVSFKARLFSNAADARTAQVWLYGATSGGHSLPDENWKLLKTFTVSNAWFETFHYRSKDASDTYRAFRLAVVGVPGAEARGDWAQTPVNGPVRVLLDELFVGEAIYPTVGFRYCYPVKTFLDENRVSPAALVDASGNVIGANPDEQPLLGENWTIQAEIEAKQLPDEIDWEREPRVFFHWYASEIPWGYGKWEKTFFATPRTAELARAEGEKMIFRGSFGAAPTAIVDEKEDVDSAVCQYMASVVYWDKAGDVHTNLLNRAWIKPSWYDPVDYNAEIKPFSAFTILERVAPGRAWINEVNVYDGRDGDMGFPAEKNQYVEIAVPEGQSLAGWRLDYVNDSRTATNVLARFGTGLGQVCPVKTDPMTNDYVFVAVASPATDLAGTWQNVRRPDGKLVEIDGTWANFDNGGGILEQRKPIGLRLVRPSGAVAQEIVLEGKNRYADTVWAGSSSLSNYVAELRHSGGKWYAVGDEADNDPVVGLKGRSLGVLRETGAVSNDWTSATTQTPGWCNPGQIVPEDYAIFANGAMVVITARIEGGHLVQTFGDAVETTESVRVTTAKGGPGTNLVYTVDAWYELAGVTTNKGEVAALPAGVRDPKTGRQTYSLVVGAGCSNSVSVVATARAWNELEKTYGLEPGGKYTAAVMDWLSSGKNLWGEGFKNPGVIRLGEYWSLAGQKVADLSLTDMYWLDIDPTEGDWRFVAGVSEAPLPTLRTAVKAARTARDSGLAGTDDPVASQLEKVRIKVKMYMTNTTAVARGSTPVKYAPYVLRCATPGETSASYFESGEGQWNSASFKITGDLQNGNESRAKWVPLRWFYFLPGTAPYSSRSFDAEDSATIDIRDPYDPANTGTTSGWQNFRDCLIFYGWAIDEKMMPTTVEPLTSDATLP